MLDLLKREFIANNQECNLEKIINNAYNDMQVRTIKGHNKEIKDACIDFLIRKFEEEIIGNDGKVKDEWFENFETNHSDLCCAFLNKLNSFDNIEQQGYGKAQKVINIALKHLVAYDKIDENYIEKLHMPIDSYVLKWVCGKDKYNGQSWSNLNKDNYYKIIKEIDEKITNEIEIGNKKVKVNSRIEADFYVWYITKQEIEFKDVAAAMNKLINNIDKTGCICVERNEINNVKDKADKLINTLDNLIKDNAENK